MDRELNTNTLCPYCGTLGRRMVAWDPVTGEETPEVAPPGWAVTCAVCARTSMMEEGGKLRPPTAAEMLEISMDDEKWVRMEDSEAYIRRESPYYRGRRKADGEAKR